MLMTLRTTFYQLMGQERLNFLLTNRIPRRTLTIFMGWFSKIEQPLIRDLSIGIWRRFAGLRLDEAQKTHFTSMHDCFIRQLKPGARPIDADPRSLTSPCDGIVGQCGAIDGVRVFQAKEFPYTLHDLLGDPALVARYRDGCYATIRITSSMYHRFHAPLDCRVRRVNYISGDTWNVNPIALKRVENLFCKNERAVVHAEHKESGEEILMVAVAAVLVASIRLHFLDVLLHLRYRGPNVMACDATFKKGEELGWFQHGSTIIVFAPRGFTLADGIADGTAVRVGEKLMRIPD
ncbi:MAG: archaetidylserine decarboxylase [Usitatibacteraceae bacterium]